MKHQVLLFTGGDVSRSLPANYSEEDSRYFVHELCRRIPDVYLKKVENICACDNGFLFDAISVLPDSFPSGQLPGAISGKKARLKLFAKLLVKRCVISLLWMRSESDCLWIADVWSGGYFHWMTDALPRLLAAQKTCYSGILLPQSLSRYEYVAPSLKPFYSGDIRFTGKAVRCRSLLIPTHTAPTGNYNEVLVRQLRGVYTSYYCNASAQEALPDKIYVSRSKALKRKVVNEQECISVLVRYGFHVVCLEDYEFDRQAQICLATKFMVSNHGAGLTNMLFMQAGAAVLELRKKRDFHNNCYFALASALSLKYFYQLCESSDSSEDANTADLIVDCLELEGNIQKMLLGCNG